MVIEGELEDIGVKASCSYAKQTLDVECDEAMSDEKIRNVVKKAGYELASN